MKIKFLGRRKEDNHHWKRRRSKDKGRSQAQEGRKEGSSH
jgi:hypothetical protein